MVALVLALTVGMLFSCGTYLILRRGQIKLILGLGLLSHGVNLLLFGSGLLTRGVPPVFLNKENYSADLERIAYADPLPQALILTAIVISFGITAFVIVLVNRRHTISNTDVVYGELSVLLREGDPFGFVEETGHPTGDRVDYDWLAYELDELYDQPAADHPRSEVDESAAVEAEEYD